MQCRVCCVLCTSCTLGCEVCNVECVVYCVLAVLLVVKCVECVMYCVLAVVGGLGRGQMCIRRWLHYRMVGWSKVYCTMYCTNVIGG